MVLILFVYIVRSRDWFALYRRSFLQSFF